MRKKTANYGEPYHQGRSQDFATEGVELATEGVEGPKNTFFKVKKAFFPATEGVATP